ncbi:MAG TPA: DNA replication and repair protein RecF [Candidatus Saccharibacteria bacterium]|nr:DNA replication and repair protein RecF [Candidatus Saccharibacteria bacterium]
MSISEVKVANLRSYALFEAQLDPHVTLILGPNGSGKTSLLEALYVMCRGTSFRGRDRDILAHNQVVADIRLDFSNGDTRRARLQLVATDKLNKTFTVDDKTSQRLLAKYRLPVVLFEPDELRLLSSSPQRRRQFLDDVLSRLYPAYATTLSRFNRALLQRNELLKQQESMDFAVWEKHLFVWDVKFAELASSLVRLRHGFTELANQHLSRLYSSMASKKHRVSMVYEPLGKVDSYQQKLLALLQHSHQHDALRGFTSHGPHRDDFTILLDDYPASDTASRGEMRTIMLAFKLLEVELQQELSNRAPLILMDDVFSELDITRERHLMHTLEGYQTVITATDLRDELKINAKIITLQ